MGSIWENFSENIPQYGIDAFNSVEPYFWPIIFVGIIGFLYAGMHSITIAVIGILVTLAVFGTTTSIFEAVPDVSLFLYIIALVGISMLFTVMFIKKRR